MSDLRTIEQLCGDLVVIVNGHVKEGRVVSPGLARLVSRRVNRDEALTLISDAVVNLTKMAERIGGRNHGFSERVVRHEREDEDEGERQQRLMDQQATAVSILDVHDDESVTATDDEVRCYEEIMKLPREEGLKHLHEWAQSRRVVVLRSMINYIWHGADNPWEMMKRALAITRRYYKAKIRGITMTEVARLLNEKSRCAGQSARERDIHDKLLIEWGVHAPKAADPGLKSPTTCAKNALAARGNKHRASASQKIKAEQANTNNNNNTQAIPLI